MSKLYSAIGIIIVVVITLIAFWYRGSLNSYLPASYQKSTFASGSAIYGPTAACNMVPSTINPNMSCFSCGDPTFSNLCGQI